MPWFRTSPIKEMIGSLEFAADCAATLRDRPETWRWFVLSLHLALQGALVCALKGFDTSGVAALSGTSARRTQEWLDARKSGEFPPNQQLASVRELVGRAQTWLPPSNRLPSDPRVIDDLLRLNDIRNHVSHLVTDGWSLDLSGMPRIALNTLGVIEFLTLTSPTFWHHYDGDDQDRIRRAIGNLRFHLQSLAANFASSPR
ncbi:MAG: hypothetical protein WAU68_14035 [Vitreimonas sp.]